MQFKVGQKVCRIQVLETKRNMKIYCSRNPNNDLDNIVLMDLKSYYTAFVILSYLQLLQRSEELKEVQVGTQTLPTLV